jgi:hypothetical protein
MADIDKRLRYFNGQFLEQQDFRDEQDYHVDRQRRHDRLFHTYGIAEGLTVDAPVSAGEITVAAGTALDGQGRHIVLTGQRTLTLGSSAGKTVLAVISYDELGVEPAQVGNQGEMTRWEERPQVELVEEALAEPEDTQIRLGRVVISQGGTVTSFDAGVRQAAGVRLGAGVVASGAVADGAVTTAKLADGAVTGAKLGGGAVATGHLADLGVTTAKIANQAVGTNQLADLGVITGKLANSAVVGAKILDGTINEVKLDAATRAKLGGALSSGGTVNGNLTVAGYTWAQGGIFGRGVFDQYFQTDFVFTPTDADGAVRSITTGFQPRVILVQGAVSFRFSGNPLDSNNLFGGPSNGVAVYRGFGTSGSGSDGGPAQSIVLPPDDGPPPPPPPLSQICTGPSIARFTTGNFANTADKFAGVAGAFFQNSFVSPTGTTQLVVTVSEVLADSVTFRLSRTISAGSVSPDLIPQFRLCVTILGSYEVPVDGSGNPIA